MALSRYCDVYWQSLRLTKTSGRSWGAAKVLASIVFLSILILVPAAVLEVGDG